MFKQNKCDICHLFVQTLSHVYLSSSTEMIWLIFDVFPSLSVQFKILNVPLSSHLAANHFNQQQAEQEERMRMKKLTLDINERQEQEDYQGEWTAGAHAAVCVCVSAGVDRSLLSFQKWCNLSLRDLHLPTPTESAARATSTPKEPRTLTSYSRPAAGQTHTLMM